MKFILTGAACAAISAAVLASCIGTPDLVSAQIQATKVPRQASLENVPLVSTIAGNGVLGFKDGPAMNAEFLMPVAVAGNAGSIYIVDQAAQRIRKLSAGIVSTIAGSGADPRHLGHVLGSYKDGPALQAGFNEPSSIAIGKDGSIYVTDQLNHCIRKLNHGMVSTFAGSPEKVGSADGPVAVASFSRPRAIAIDDNGTMFIADFGVGVRAISPEGIVKTLVTPDVGSKQFVALAVAGKGASETVLVSENNGLYYVIKPSTGENAVYNGLEGGGFPKMYGLAAANAFEFVASDIQENAIRLMRLSDKPDVTNNAAPIIAGSATLESQNSGGFQDGPLFDAKFYSPLGLSIVNNSVVVADSGNRRIRSLPMPDVRRPVGTDVQQLAAQPSQYRILTIGASHSFWATDWKTSIPGLIEATLIKDRARLGIKKPIEVIETRIDSSGLDTQADYLTNFVGSGQVDLVVMMFSSADLSAVHIQGAESPATAAIRTLSDLRTTLAASGTSLFVHVRPEYSLVSQVDDLYDRERVPTPNFDPTYGVDEVGKAQEAILKASGVRYHVALPEYSKYEASPNKLPLWAFQDSHENLAGRIFAAKNITEQLELAHPWSSRP